MAQHLMDWPGRIASGERAAIGARLRRGSAAVAARLRRGERPVSLLAGEELTGHRPGGAYAELGFRPPEPARHGAPFDELGCTAPVEGLEGIPRHHHDHPHAVAS
jgi:hypothetical protein